MNNSEIHKILKKVWGYDEFRAPQLDIINSILSGKDTVALLPTGGGKSICYQLPALLVSGKVLVVSPLISLMQDQVKALQKHGVNAKLLQSGMKSEEIDIVLDNFVNGPLKILYISPERIATEVFQVRYHMANVSFIAIDEAHCISQWGHDFRPSYLKISLLRELKPNIPLIALTATATPKILDDISTQLFLNKPNIYTKSFARDNISFSVLKTEDKMFELLRILNQVHGSVIIYIRNRLGCGRIATWLNEKKISSTIYHAGLAYTEREANQQSWMSGQYRIMVATNAFGMGIDKKDVRCVIHMDMPSSIEDYYQEAGRAGRDGLPSFAVTLINNSDVLSLGKVFDSSYPEVAEVKSIFIALCRYLQVAVGYGEASRYLFDMEEFSSKYKINAFKIQSVLKTLEKQDLIIYTDGIKNPGRVMFLADPGDLHNSYDQNDVRYLLLVQLLRDYDGLYIEPTVINLIQLSNQLQLDITRIEFLLKVLQSEGTILYQPFNELPEIVFNVNRPSDDDFVIDERKYMVLREEAQHRMFSMIGYFTSDKCRQQMLLDYFNESGPPCGKCDVCKGSFEIVYTPNDKKMVLQNLLDEKQAVSIKSLLVRWPFNKRRRIAVCIEDLEKEGFIVIDEKGMVMRKNRLNLNP